MDVRMFTVGMVQENCFLFRREGSDRALIVDPGDVLFQGSVGRTDLPGGDWPTLLESIRSLVDALPGETTVYPGHMGITTLGAERATNPFLTELARSS